MKDKVFEAGVKATFVVKWVKSFLNCIYSRILVEETAKQNNERGVCLNWTQ